MITQALILLGFSGVCGAWVFLQRWFAAHDSEAPTIETRGHDGGCGGCGGSACKRNGPR